jgi:hypothetical protein
MNIKKGFILRDMGEFSVVVASGEILKEYNCMITLNQSGKMLWKLLEIGASKQELLKAMLDEYEVDESTAKEHIDGFLNKLEEAKILENT